MPENDLDWTHHYFDSIRVRNASPIIKAPPNARVWVALTGTDTNDDLHILIGRRGPNINKAGYWNLFGGNVDPGENLVEAAKRELKEETGLVLPDAAYRTLYQAEVHDGEKHCTWFVVNIGDLQDLHEYMLKWVKTTDETDQYSVRALGELPLLSSIRMHYSLDEFLKIPLRRGVL